MLTEVIPLTDQEYMKRALELAKQGEGWTSPNPVVGAVIVKEGRIIGEGCHLRCGQAHAERNALAACTEDPAGATMYVTLEPCCHEGRQPACTDAILAAKLARVVIGSADPNPLVDGRGAAMLRAHGVEVEENVMREECDRANEIFFHYIRTGRPYVAMKYAMSADGKIAAYTGESRWVTGEIARNHVQVLRNRYRAIMVGVGTVLTDDPRLTCRLEGGRPPVRVICDSNLRTPVDAQVVRTAGEAPTVLATCCAEEEKHRPYLEAGCQVLVVDSADGRVDLDRLMTLLGEQEIASVLLEGGGTLNWAALNQGLVHRVYTYIAPKLFGGRYAKTPVEGRGFPSPNESVHLINGKITLLGEDILMESEVDRGVYGDR